ncbi:ATP-binding protein [Actinokineospora bangkokensis]|uniref:Histidine kinase/HSP90-like ATPase domain-containing protein n=1 Tax=Actinokineospora bangkokensis TaxID=1193682 RepID=A0A1Q9LK06_9PSEU|nr:ATP-binding protein [Actinokineospora bangkokensis]OLR92350.1 hypothetical protein BJP25_19855 [Actinokineospora bangkokensis]
MPDNALGLDGHHEAGRTTGEVAIDTSLSCEDLAAVRGAIADVLDGRPRGFVGDVQLVATELGANACDHADAPRHLVLRREVHDERGAELVIEVRDATPGRLPVVGVSRFDETRGRGMRMVEAVCNDWGVREEDGVKVVWGRLPMP